MNDPTPIGSTLDTIAQPATEIVTAADGTRAAIQWKGTAVTGEWITAYVESRSSPASWSSGSPAPAPSSSRRRSATRTVTG